MFGCINSIIQTKIYSWWVDLKRRTDSISPMFTTDDGYRFHFTAEGLDSGNLHVSISNGHDHCMHANMGLFCFGVTFCTVPATIMEAKLGISIFPEFQAMGDGGTFRTVKSDTFKWNEAVYVNCDESVEVEVMFRYLDNPGKYMPRDVRQIILNHEWLTSVVEREYAVTILTADERKIVFDSRILQSESEYFSVLLKSGRWLNVAKTVQIQEFKLDYDLSIVSDLQKLCDHKRITHSMQKNLLKIYMCAEQYLFNIIAAFLAAALRQDNQVGLSKVILNRYPTLRDSHECPHITGRTFTGTVQENLLT